MGLFKPAGTPKPRPAELQVSKASVEGDVKVIADLYAQGKYKTPDGKPLTAYRAGRAICALFNREKMPSVGTITEVFERWEKVGAAVCTRGPYAFDHWTDAATDVGITELKKRHQVAALRAARERREAREADDARVAE